MKVVNKINEKNMLSHGESGDEWNSVKGTDEERFNEAYQDKEDHFGEGKAFCGVIILQISAGAFEVKT